MAEARRIIFGTAAVFVTRVEHDGRAADLYRAPRTWFAISADGRSVYSFRALAVDELEVVKLQVAFWLASDMLCDLDGLGMCRLRCRIA